LLLAFTTYKNLFSDDYTKLRTHLEASLLYKYFSVDRVISAAIEETEKAIKEARDKQETAKESEQRDRLMHLRLFNRLMGNTYITKDYPLCIAPGVNPIDAWVDAVIRSTDEASMRQALRGLDGNQLAPTRKLLVSWAGREWRVLEVKDNKALLLSEYLLEDYRQFNPEGKGNTWSTCTLHDYLNEEFYNSLGEAKTDIVHSDIETEFPNDRSKTIKTPNHIFLLSVEEIFKYFNTDDAYTYNAIKNVVDIKQNPSQPYLDNKDNYRRQASRKGDEGSHPWWLRSPGRTQNFAATVTVDGSVDLYGSSVNDTNFGVRPALWLNL
jgi:hypothetical protein